MGYSVLSKYRSELMGAAMLWVMLFHAADLTFPIPGLDLFRAAGFGGVDIFILLSAMGLSLSLSRLEQEYGAFLARRARRILPAYFVVMVPYTLFLILRGQAPLSALVWNSTLLAYWVHAPGAFNWYVSGILLFYVLTPWCFRRLRRSRHRVLWTAGAGAAAVAVCHVLIQDEYWHYLDVFYRFPIFFLGLLVGLYVWEDRRLGRRDLLFWTLWLAAGLCYLAAALPRLEVPHLPMCHLFLFTTVPMCLAGCACFVLLVNASPAFARAVSDVPVLGGLARVVTVTEYHIDERERLIDVRLPALELAANTDLEQRVNTEIRTRIDQVLQEAEDRARETREAYVATGGAQSDFIPIIITVDYEIKCQNGQYLSFVLTKTETLASAYTEVYTYNIDLPAGREVSLRDLLGPNYKQLANQAIRAEIARREAEDPDNRYFHGEDGVEGFTSIADDQRFYLNGDGVPVVVFEKYEIAPGYMGEQEFEIIP